MSYILVYLITCLAFVHLVDEEFNTDNWLLSVFLTLIWPLLLLFAAIAIVINLFWDLFEVFVTKK